MSACRWEKVGWGKTGGEGHKVIFQEQREWGKSQVTPAHGPIICHFEFNAQLAVHTTMQHDRGLLHETACKPYCTPASIGPACSLGQLIDYARNERRKLSASNTNTRIQDLPIHWTCDIDAQSVANLINKLTNRSSLAHKWVCLLEAEVICQSEEDWLHRISPGDMAPPSQAC